MPVYSPFPGRWESKWSSGIQNEILDGESWCLFSNEPYEKKTAMTIEDFVLYSDETISSLIFSGTGYTTQYLSWERKPHMCARALARSEHTHTYIHAYHTKLRLHWYTGVDIEAGASSPTATDSPTGGTSGATGLGRGPGVVGCMVGRGTRRGWKWTKAMQYLQITIQNNLSNMSAWFVAQGV